MKRILIGTALALLTLGAAQAQNKDRGTPEERAKVHTERMVKNLGLDADQTAKVEAINLKYAQKGDDFKAERKADSEGMKGKGQTMWNERMAELKAVLTPEQYQKLEAAQEKMKEKRLERRQETQGERKQ